jgi:hypothetical protein
VLHSFCQSSGSLFMMSGVGVDFWCVVSQEDWANCVLQSMASFNKERTKLKRPTTTHKSTSGFRTAGQTDIRCVRNYGNREKSMTGCQRA